MQLLTTEFLDRFPAINVHPSLLPQFPGRHAVEDAIAAGVPQTGVTVHIVDEGLDTGRVLLQEAVPVLAGDTPETLHARLQAVEHRLLPEAARRFLARGLGS
jgi:phosphoribosylglycinamide formyltransferase 1